MPIAQMAEYEDWTGPSFPRPGPSSIAGRWYFERENSSESKVLFNIIQNEMGKNPIGHRRLCQMQTMRSILTEIAHFLMWWDWKSKSQATKRPQSRALSPVRAERSHEAGKWWWVTTSAFEAEKNTKRRGYNRALKVHQRDFFRFFIFAFIFCRCGMTTQIMVIVQIDDHILCNVAPIFCCFFPARFFFILPVETLVLMDTRG